MAAHKIMGALLVATLGSVIFGCGGGSGSTGVRANVNPVPFISQPLVPGAVAPGGTAFTLTVNGTGFVAGSVVNWNGSSRQTTFVNASQLQTEISASDISTAVTAAVTVFSPAPGGGTSNVSFLQVTDPAA